jgi:DNA-binding MurR/RpiR family transcriptional regulator
MAVPAHDSPRLDERVAARIGELTSTERRIAEYFAEHPQEVAFGSADELSAATNTSDASVVRTAKALGYDGLPGLKRALRAQLQGLLTPANRLRNSLESLGSGHEAVLRATLRDHIDRLEQTERTLDPSEFGRAIELIYDARETMICGFAGLGGVAEYIATHLVRIGIRARAATETGYRLADRLLLLGGEDVVIVVAQNRVNRETRIIIDHCAKIDVPVVLITDTLGEALRDDVSVVLTAPMSRPGTFTSQATVLILLEALTIAVAAHDRDRALDKNAQLNRLREKLNGYSLADEAALNLVKPRQQR